MSTEIGEEDMVSIDECVTHKLSTSNTVEIKVTRVTRGNEVTLGSSVPPPFPIPHILLNNNVSFDPHNIYALLYPSLHDPFLCNILSNKIASEAERVPGPLYIYLHVTLTPQIFLDAVEEDVDTCAVCLEEDRHLSVMTNCSHRFHDDCINEWLCWSNYCPLCRAEIVDDEHA